MLTCTGCGIEKDEKEFRKQLSTKRGYTHKCKECLCAKEKEYRKSEKMQILYKDPVYRLKKKLYERNRLNKDLRFCMYRNTKARSKRDGIPFNLEIEDIVIPKFCPILGLELETAPYGTRSGFKMNSASIDKIIPELGYIKGNVQVISMKANAMKYSATKEELVQFCTNILKQINNGTMDSKN